MNQQQRNYALNRVDEIFKDKKAAITAKHTVEGKSLSSEERADLVRSGKIKMRADCREIDTHDYVRSVFDFSKFETKDSKDQKKIDAEIKKLKQKCDAAKDEMMLGDEDVARKMLSELEAA